MTTVTPITSSVPLYRETEVRVPVATVRLAQATPVPEPTLGPAERAPSPVVAQLQPPAGAAASADQVTVTHTEPAINENQYDLKARLPVQWDGHDYDIVTLRVRRGFSKPESLVGVQLSGPNGATTWMTPSAAHDALVDKVLAMEPAPGTADRVMRVLRERREMTHRLHEEGQIETRNAPSTRQYFDSWDVVAATPTPEEPDRYMRLKALRYPGSDYKPRQFELSVGNRNGEETGYPVGYSWRSDEGIAMMQALDPSRLDPESPVRTLVERFRAGVNDIPEARTTRVVTGSGEPTGDYSTSVSRAISRAELLRVIGPGYWTESKADPVLIGATIDLENGVLKLTSIGVRSSILEDLDGHGSSDDLKTQTALRFIALLAHGMDETELARHPPLAAAVREAGAQDDFMARQPSEPGLSVVWRAAHVTEAQQRDQLRKLGTAYGPLAANVGWPLESFDERRERPLVDAVTRTSTLRNDVDREALLGMALGNGFDGVVGDSLRGLSGAVEPTEIEAPQGTGLASFFGEQAHLAQYLPRGFQRGVDYDVRRYRGDDGRDHAQVVFLKTRERSAMDNAMIAASAMAAQRSDFAQKQVRRRTGNRELLPAERRFLTALGYRGGMEAITRFVGLADPKRGFLPRFEHTPRTRVELMQLEAMRDVVRGELIRSVGVFDAR